MADERLSSAAGWVLGLFGAYGAAHLRTPLRSSALSYPQSHLTFCTVTPGN